jgi:hypothetical protein
MSGGACGVNTCDPSRIGHAQRRTEETVDACSVERGEDW